MPLFKPRTTTPRSPVTEKAANSLQYQKQQQQQQHHQSGDNNDQSDNGAVSSNGTDDRSSNGIALQHEQTTRVVSRVPKQTLIFHCQLAHGSPTGLISDFSNVRELYQKIADCYELPVEEVSIHTYINMVHGNCKAVLEMFPLEEIVY